MIGKMILSIREMEGVSQESLCKNILTQTALSYIESEKNIPSFLVQRILFQRLGKNPDYFNTIISLEEYKYVVWQKQILKKIEEQEVISDREWNEMDQTMANEVLKEQFKLFYQAYEIADVEGMILAISKTVDDFPKLEKTEHRISSTEIFYMLLCVEKIMESNKEDKFPCENCLRFIMKYVNEFFQPDEKAKIYGKAVCLLAETGVSEEEIRQVLISAIEFQQRNACLFDMEELLLKYIKVSEHLQIPVEAVYEKGYQAIIDMKETLELPDIKFLHRVYLQEYYLANEVYRMFREERGFSVKQIEDTGIISARSYREIENGKRKANKNTGKLIAETINSPYQEYNVELDTDNYENILLVQEINHLFRTDKDDEGEKKLQILESNLEKEGILHQPRNQQYIQCTKYMLKFFDKEITGETFRKEIIRELQLTIPDWNEEYGIHFYSKGEMYLLYYLALTYYKEKLYKNAQNIIDMAWKQFESSETSTWCRKNEARLFMQLRKNLASSMGDYDGGIRLTKEAAIARQYIGLATRMEEYVFELAWIDIKRGCNLNNPQIAKKCTEYLQCALDFSRLYHEEESERVILRYGEKVGLKLC